MTINPLRKLELPRRWELLAQRAASVSVDPSVIVEKVDDAANRVDALMRRVRDGAGGVIEVFYGLSGSGKTTFFRTIPKFFSGVNLTLFPNTLPLRNLPSFIKNDYVSEDKNNRIVLIERRDNPTADDLSQLDETFGELVDVFREPDGAAVVLWPVTNRESAQKIAETAWAVGRDSMADKQSNGQYHFKGVEKNRYWDLADTTSRTLTGDGLEAFGVTPDSARALLPKCDTISDYFAEVAALADTQRNETWSVLKARVIPRLWVVLPGDDELLIRGTADALTQGTKRKIDIDKIGELIDIPEKESIYIAEWKKRRGQLAHLLRAIDVRLFDLPPNVALAAIRSCGDPSIKSLLNNQTTGIEQSKDAMKACRLYKAILEEAGVMATAFAGTRRLGRETADEYLRIQKRASSDDKPLNKALGQLIALCLADDAPTLKVLAEKRSLPGSNLQPDIQIELGIGEYICLEPTWRTSGARIDGGAKSAQNTLSEAHLKKYVLDKATSYVKDLGL